MEYLGCVFCSKDATMIKTHENHCPPGAFVDIDREDWCESLARIEGTQCSLLNGKGMKGHMVSWGQSWDEEPHLCFLLPPSLLEALMGPPCSPRPRLESSLSRPQALV